MDKQTTNSLQVVQDIIEDTVPDVILNTRPETDHQTYNERLTLLEFEAEARRLDRLLFAVVVLAILVAAGLAIYSHWPN